MAAAQDATSRRSETKLTRALGLGIITGAADDHCSAIGAELADSRRDILVGMAFSNIIMYFIILSTGATLHQAGQAEIETAAQAAKAPPPATPPPRCSASASSPSAFWRSRS
ncbi:divalent metal cation transporter [Bradyrhizobium cenepequi]|uniref:divalent metal cation transporter n=1 Tax=Bradyrhizobium cenepequi TaxID=2821403 RepID=UPI001CE30921|nr:divalent metal cation transporter [Bradyrhizobium cenepequi]MCA6108648.1 hypothetical protein [Bradyrhizobium cenepequi]